MCSSDLLRLGVGNLYGEFADSSNGFDSRQGAKAPRVLDISALLPKSHDSKKICIYEFKPTLFSISAINCFLRISSISGSVD